MAFCTKCGGELKDGQKFCATCGESVPGNKNGVDVNAVLNSVMNTEDSTANFDTNDIETNKVWGILSYIGVLVLIPMFAVKDSPYVKYHVGQGFVLFLLGLGYTILSGMISLMVNAMFGEGVLTVLVGLVFGLFGLVVLALSVLGIVNVATGKAKELPVIGRIKILK